jgi:ubiquinone/menaquinone biosynthesis C-methylase UbiE
MVTKQSLQDEQRINEVRDFWNSRAGLGEWAGTRDVTAKQLEMEAIAAYVRDGLRVIDIGCGNGIMAIELARRYAAEVTGVDYAEEMVTAARALAEQQSLKGKVQFRLGDLRNLSQIKERFDVAYTERAIINLPDWPTQRQAILDVGQLLAPGGLFVMCENSQDGLDKINALREQTGLKAVIPPWHNRYLKDSEIEQADFPGLKLEQKVFYSSTYYFLSRVVNAWLAAQEGKEPDYDATINRLALLLPSMGDLGQGRIWLWRKL